MENYFINKNILTINRWRNSNYVLDADIYRDFFKVDTINFDYYSTQLPMKLPNNIKRVIFYCDIKYDLSKYLPDFIEEIELNNDANCRISNLPNTVKKITFGFNYNQILDDLPDSIEEIVFNEHPELRDSRFNNEINNLPKKLKKLVLSQDFNQTVDNLPINLETLIFKLKFNKSIDFLPQNLRILKLDRDFNYPLNNLPNNLEVLIINTKNYNHNFDNLPKNLKHFTFTAYNYEKRIVLPEKLEVFIYSIYKNRVNIEFNDNLKIFSTKNPYDIFPSSLETLLIGFDFFFFETEESYIELFSSFNDDFPITQVLPKNLKKLCIPLDKKNYVNNEFKVVYNDYVKISLFNSLII